MLKKLFGNKNEVELKSPINGKVVALSEVPDQKNKKKMVGDGFAIIPKDGCVCSPVDGKILQIFPTKHAIGLLTNEGLEVLIHFGIDTVELKGEGFTSYITAGDEVKVGDKLIDVDLSILEKNGKSPITPVIFTANDQYKSFEVNYGNVECGDSCVKVKMNKR